MNKEIIMPDYNHSILNLVNSILKHYQVKTNHTSLKQLDNLLQKDYTNIVLLVLDGMGENVLKTASPEGILAKHQVDTITSVFPCTTTAALTTYYSGKAPLETGWLAWSQYFKEYGRAIDMLPYIDSYTREPLPRNKFDAYKLLQYETTYSQIENATNNNVKTYEIKPSHCDMKTNKCIHIKNFEELCNSIETLCTSQEKKYIFSYFDSPDSINHKYGWDSNETKDFILYAEKQLSKLQKKLLNTNTLFIICADHGHNNIKHHYNILELDDLNSCFIMPPFLEPRFTSFWIKSEKKPFFEEKFKEIFKNDFLLYSKKDFENLNLLGYGQKNKKIDDFIGNYISIAISDSAINLGTYLSNEKPNKLSDHCGLTKNEMEVPLIVFNLK